MKPDLMQTPSSSRAAGPRLVLAAAALCGALTLRAQTVPFQLAPVVVSATRVAEPSSNVGTAIDVVSGADVERQQLTTFAAALSGVAGAPAFATGQTGAATSLFLRGANSNQTLFLVDGIRLNDANTDYANFLGGARIFPTDSIEVARGPQSTLYGSEAVGGVVSLRMAPGTGQPAETVTAEAGSFGTVDGVVTAQAALGPWAYNVAVSGEQTQNDRVNNALDSTNVALRLDDQISTDLHIGATLRGLVQRYGDPGDAFTNNLLDYEREENWLATVFADFRLTENILSHLTFGGQERRFVAVVPAPGRPAQVSVTKNLRGVLDWQFTARLTENNLFTGGVTAESGSTIATGFGNINKHQTLFSYFGEDEWTPIANLHLTGGLRHDDYNTFGGATTGRATLAWLIANGMVKVRGSYGSGFDAPSFLDLYAKSAFFVGNPTLRPETSHGWDGGLDIYLPGDKTTLSATGFQTDYGNLIIDNFNVFPGTAQNVERARTRGVELSANTILFNHARAKVAYTYLEARNLSENTALLRRPRNSLAADLWSDLGGGFTAGVGGSYVGRRPDVDARTFATVIDPGYTVVRAYAAWQASQRLTLKARIENALGRQYEPVNGYPQPGTGIYGSVELKF